MGAGMCQFSWSRGNLGRNGGTAPVATRNLSCRGHGHKKLLGMAINTFTCLLDAFTCLRAYAGGANLVNFCLTLLYFAARVVLVGAAKLPE
jgi:hypothetical protein